MSTPVLVMNETTKRSTGREAQRSNIDAAFAVSQVVRTTLGPRSMLKMILDPMGGIVLTNDGNAILREISVEHPASKTMIEIARTVDSEIGDGTTSTVCLAGQLLFVARPLLDNNVHPRHMVMAYIRALDVALEELDRIAVKLDTSDKESMLRLVRSCLGTKFTSRFGDLIPNLAIAAVRAVTTKNDAGQVEVDIKRYARVEKIPGGYLEDSAVLDGLMLNKDVTHPKMPRHIENPRILLLDCPLEYKKGESQTNIEITQETDWDEILRQEEEYIERLCKDIIKHKPNVVFTEKGVSDLAQHYLLKENIAVIRRVRKTDNDRIARAVGATIVNEPANIQEHDIGLGCGVFDIRKIGDEYFTYLEKCKDPKAVSIVLRGASKDVLMEVERNLQDAMTAVRNILLDPRVAPGGGATELAIGRAIRDKAKEIEGVQQWPFRQVAEAFEVIPKTLIENCGANPVRIITDLRAKHAGGLNFTWGVNGETGEPTDMNVLQIFEPITVKSQAIKTAIETACMLLRIDDIVSGMQGAPHKQAGDVDPEEADTFGDERDG